MESTNDKNFVRMPPLSSLAILLSAALNMVQQKVICISNFIVFDYEENKRTSLSLATNSLVFIMISLLSCII